MPDRERLSEHQAAAAAAAMTQGKTKKKKKNSINTLLSGVVCLTVINVYWYKQTNYGQT